MPLKYNSFLKPYARTLRSNSTLGEIMLWNQLKNDKLGVRFYRQRPLLKYIIDFYCPALKLAIELDGKYHNSGEQQIKDATRDEELTVAGVKVLRFTEQDVRKRLLWVLECIEDYGQSGGVG